ncbi:MAG: hypothetical protein OSB61_07980, partial [Verrucomicrobiota bacterium]|nr:hypothetical protein [Verrucomicrobiota bacterium]
VCGTSRVTDLRLRRSRREPARKSLGNRRIIDKKLILILVAGLFPLMLQAEAKKRPNILFIVADDQSLFDFLFPQSNFRFR